MRSKWVAVCVICLLSARPSAAGEPPHAMSGLIERAARPAGLKGIGEASGTSALDAHSEPRRLSGRVAILAQPANSAPASRSWFLRHSVLVGVVAGAAVGVLGATTGDNRLFCPGSDESCVLHSGGLKVVGVGIIAGLGGVAGYLVGLGW